MHPMREEIQGRNQPLPPHVKGPRDLIRMHVVFGEIRFARGTFGTPEPSHLRPHSDGGSKLRRRRLSSTRIHPKSPTNDVHRYSNDVKYIIHDVKFVTNDVKLVTNDVKFLANDVTD